MLPRMLRATAIVMAMTVTGCQAGSPPAEESVGLPAREDGVATTAPASFVNTVWTVAESEQIAHGELRVFLSEGTLVLASPNGIPAFGRWRYDNGQLTITEDGLDYRVDILESTQDVFRVRIHSPGDPVIIRFEPAAGGPHPGNGSSSPEP